MDREIPTAGMAQTAIVPPTDVLSVQTDSSLAFGDSEVEDMASPSSPATETLTKSQTSAGDDAEDELSSKIPELKSWTLETQSLSDRMRQLAAAAWALEQDDNMTDRRRKQVTNILQRLEQTIEFDRLPNNADDSATELEDETYKSKKELATKAPPEKVALDQPYIDAPRENPVQDYDDSARTDMQEAEDHMDEIQLQTIHISLAETVRSMRLRHQEQKHLHQLTIQKLETIAQRCISQEAQLHTAHQELKALRTETASLRVENKLFGRENDSLQSRIEELQAESARKEVAVSAMTSAVKGLEGWIDSTTPQKQSSTLSQLYNGHITSETHHLHNESHIQHHQHIYQQPSPYRPLRNKSTNKTSTPNQTPNPHSSPTPTSQRRTIIRGKGRFRGRFYVDDEDNQIHNGIHNGVNGDHNTSHDTNGNLGPDAQDLQDGVRAWIRGFKDVEECVSMNDYVVHSPASTPVPVSGKRHVGIMNGNNPNTKINSIGNSNDTNDDEWGDFQNPLVT